MPLTHKYTQLNDKLNKNEKLYTCWNKTYTGYKIIYLCKNS